MIKELEQYLENPRANKIHFIKLLRTLTGADLKTAKGWADNAFGPNLTEVNAVLAGINVSATNTYELCKMVVMVLENFYGVGYITADTLEHQMTNSPVIIRGDRLYLLRYYVDGKVCIFARMHR